MNIHKSGRELDIMADHRLEPRRAIGECKATSSPIGGDDLNKFVGALDVEHEDKRPITGYFISLGGFRETAIEQEKQRRRTKIVMLTGAQVVSELVKGRILVGEERAAELAGRCAESADVEGLALDPQADLLAHERGWIWAIYYTQGKARTHFVLIHSDGTLLARLLVDEVVAADQCCGGGLVELDCLNPQPLQGSHTDPLTAKALAAYDEYLTNECGFIHLDGMPADTDVGSRRMTLENLFVPLHLDVTPCGGSDQKKSERQSVGDVLTNYPRLALLAAPGAGKSTLIKRLAVSYADPTRRGKIDDKLPSRNWLPLFFRCRELRDLARGSFTELLEALSQREPVRQYAALFRAHVDRELLAGRVLLLVDGLDEISDPGDRAAFVCTVRTALQAYPGIAIVVTSREAGFRHVAAHLAPVCTPAVVSPFNGDDIRRLSVAWHTEVVGDTEKVRTDAEQLADSIAQSDRIKRLAVNPLLLTTLLLVKRWVGSLPTRRGILYGKAVEVLLMTWNTEGHAPIPEEEALPQLCYVASSMMLNQVERISRPRLAKMLQEARDALPTELGYVQGTVEDFIHRVEDRSSLLMMTGHDVEDGKLVEFFEFRHLTFQEFLTARAMVEGWHPNRGEQDTLATVLAPHFQDEKWREVIPLAAVLGGKETEAVIRGLSDIVRQPSEAKGIIASTTLLNCLADEAAARPGTVEAAIRAMVRRGIQFHTHVNAFQALLNGRYGPATREAAERIFISAEDEEELVGAADTLLLILVAEMSKLSRPEAVQNCIEMLEAGDRLLRCKGALGVGLTFKQLSAVPELSQLRKAEIWKRSELLIEPLVFEAGLPEQLSGAYALGAARSSRHHLLRDPDLLDRLVYLWRKGANDAIRRQAARAIACQPISADQRGLHFSAISVNEIRASFPQDYDRLDEWSQQPAALVVAWYTNALDDADLAKYANAFLQRTRESGFGVDAQRDNIVALAAMLEIGPKQS